jgi:hypothetical protein
MLVRFLPADEWPADLAAKWLLVRQVAVRRRAAIVG